MFPAAAKKIDTPQQGVVFLPSNWRCMLSGTNFYVTLFTTVKGGFALAAVTIQRYST
jgi:hypothetical protein